MCITVIVGLIITVDQANFATTQGNVVYQQQVHRIATLIVIVPWPTKFAIQALQNALPWALLLVVSVVGGIASALSVKFVISDTTSAHNATSKKISLVCYICGGGLLQQLN